MLPQIGQTVEMNHQFTQADFDLFARLTGDDNPIHVDPEFSARTRFGRTVSHGMLLYGMICGLLNHHFPGTFQLSQQLKFPAPTFAGEPITIRASVVELVPAAQQAAFAISIVAEDGRITCEGETVLRWPNRLAPHKR